MLEQLRDKLTDIELAVAQEVFALAPASIDVTRSTVEEKGGFLRCVFVAVRDQHCPFELHFGRGELQNRFNFFMGLGAEFANMEPLGNSEEARELASDIRNFLTSTIRVAGERKDGSVIKEDYTGSKLLLPDGTPLRFSYAGVRVGLFAKKDKYTREYAPWASATENDDRKR
ncbi:MAG TPA: hypothetical protein VFN67_35550 [Polyangiales bacterium]|nr:hypothetical protein [Polyangiales bacterium]